MLHISPLDALIVVDVQNDFLPGGTLPLTGGNHVVEPCNRLIALPFQHQVLTQDWHPPTHISFAETHGRPVFDVLEFETPEGLVTQHLWPTHCVAGTPGADFAPGLNTSRADLIVRKGTRERIDSYSAFIDNDRRFPNGLHSWLRERRVRRVFVAGLALDVCVRATAIDAAAFGYEVFIVREATCATVPLESGDWTDPPGTRMIDLGSIVGA